MKAHSTAANDGHPSVASALAEVTALLERDGFTANWLVGEGGGLTFEVGTTEAACAECLVPKPVLEAIVSDALDGTGHSLAELRLPQLD